MFSNLVQGAEERLITHDTASTLDILSQQKRIQSSEIKKWGIKRIISIKQRRLNFHF